MGISELWNSGTEDAWLEALGAYYKAPSVNKNIELEEKMEQLDAEAVRLMPVEEFYSFLHDDYYVWKYTAKNRLATTRRELEKYIPDGMNELGKIRDDIFKYFSFDSADTETLLSVATRIRGLGAAGASGLLAVLFPAYYGTVDQFLVQRLLEIEGLPEHGLLTKMNPENLKIKDVAVLEQILRKKAAELNTAFCSKDWSPRRISLKKEVGG